MVSLDLIISKLAAASADHGARDDQPRAAVAAIFRELAGQPAELFFIRRAEDPRDPWSGHIAFPGGRRDPEDDTLVMTAIRETREEVGIDLTSAKLLARLPDIPAFMRSKRGNLVVTPFVFALQGDVTVTPNAEVAQALWVPFTTFARGEGKGTMAYPWENRVLDLPCYRLGPEQHVLWGMTYRMLETLLEALGLV